MLHIRFDSRSPSWQDSRDNEWQSEAWYTPEFSPQVQHCAIQLTSLSFGSAALGQGLKIQLFLGRFDHKVANGHPFRSSKNYVGLRGIA
jgi:hypothetical protein